LSDLQNRPEPVEAGGCRAIPAAAIGGVSCHGGQRRNNQERCQHPEAMFAELTDHLWLLDKLILS
jgi:hypothetical protein